jgi:hypothetical protein
MFVSSQTATSIRAESKGLREYTLFSHDAAGFVTSIATIAASFVGCSFHSNDSLFSAMLLFSFGMG